MDSVARNLIILVASVWGGLFSFYGFLAYRARLWSPLWAISATEKTFDGSAAKLGSSEEESPIKRGRHFFRELRCGVCHGPDGQGGVKNPNADPEGMVPNLYDLADAFTWKDLKDKIRKGAHPAKLDDDKLEPPLAMPSWEGVASDGEIEDLAHYLFSLKSPTESQEPKESAGQNVEEARDE
ncbi:MAG: hypothetical protein A3G41_00335 [Elusimicrobia bacterium RIFCSPLOWO2_12_FULL_59_9]|nr:MAG: hypothetical protein A3G41_00335 [Elusimicrobia bacterium RIFCSPLOWO2_12_FULL_59_9]